MLLRWLAAERPDVACLQELKSPQEKFPEGALRETGYHSVWHGQKSWNGVAILARAEAPVEVARGLPGNPDDPGTVRRVPNWLLATLLVGRPADFSLGNRLLDFLAALFAQLAIEPIDLRLGLVGPLDASLRLTLSGQDLLERIFDIDPGVALGPRPCPWFHGPRELAPLGVLK